VEGPPPPASRCSPRPLRRRGPCRAAAGRISPQTLSEERDPQPRHPRQAGLSLRSTCFERARLQPCRESPPKDRASAPAGCSRHFRVAAGPPAAAIPADLRRRAGAATVEATGFSPWNPSLRRDGPSGPGLAHLKLPQCRSHAPIPTAVSAPVLRSSTTEKAPAFRPGKPAASNENGALAPVHTSAMPASRPNSGRRLCPRAAQQHDGESPGLEAGKSAAPNENGL